MNRNYLLSATALVALAILLAGCSADTPTDGVPKALVPIGVCTVMTGDGPTRAAANLQVSQFEAAETFCVHFGSGTAVLEDGRSLISTMFTTDGQGGATAAVKPFFNPDATETTIRAYYPSTVSASSSSFTVQADQTEATGYKASDLMYATATATKSGTSVTVPLLFTHLLAKVIVIAHVEGDISNIKGVDIVSGYRTVDITDGSACTIGTTLSDGITADAPVSLYSDATGAATVTCAAVLPPQDIDGNFIRVTTLNSGTATYDVTRTLTAGHVYTVVLNISRAGLAPTLTAVANWSDPVEAYDDPNETLHF